MNVLPFDRNRLVDAAERRAVCEQLDESFLVEAAAGTGKTTVLVDRLVNVLAHGHGRIDQVVAVTFTRKAAGELKLRLRQRLDNKRAEVTDGAARARLEDAIARLEEARIGTIHSFCADLLRERPVEAHIDPGFVEVSDDEGPRLYREAFDRFLQEQLAELPEGLRRVLARLAISPHGDESPLERLCAAGMALAEWRDYPTPWRRPELDREGAIDLLVERVRRLAALSRRGGNARDPLRIGLQGVELLANWVERAETAAGERDYDSLEARLVELRKELSRGLRLKGWGKFAEGLPREQVVGERDVLRTELEAFERSANADLAALLQGELRGAAERYEALKRSLGKLDFFDLLLRTRDLLRDDPAVREHLQSRISHLFVDEFQDTDALQTEILLLLAADDPAQTDWRQVRPAPGKLFLVGDPKQSIYRFRRADVLLYQQVKEQLRERGVRVCELRSSFRSTPTLQRFVNRAFASWMDGREQDGVPSYIALERGRAEASVLDQPSIVALPVPRPYGQRRIANWAIEESLPDATAAWLDWLLRESGWRVWDRERDDFVPVAARHVCLLFRRYLSWGRDVTRPYVRALEQRGIAHLLIGARTFHRREEVETIRSALIALEWPDDELAVYATLRGSLLALPDDLLLRFGVRYGFHPLAWRRRAEVAPAAGEDLSAVAEALDLLARLHRRRNARPIVETLRELFAATRAWAGFAFRPSGHQVLANVERVVELARGYELEGGISFRGFVEQLNREAERPASSQAPVVEEGADGVRLMTVHNAKGLEFPVVVLADMTANLSTREPGLALDAEHGLAASRLLGLAPLELLERAEVEKRRDQAEGVRVAYVAATRARDLLVVPALGDEKHNGWLAPLNDALYPEPGDWRRARALDGLPDFGDRSVVERPVECEVGPETSVRPGVHGSEQDGALVLWWDPNVLPRSIDQHFGLRQEELLAEDESGDAASAVAHSSRVWGERQERARSLGRTPSERVAIVTELEEAPPGEAREVMEVTLQRSGSRPSGRRFGDLVHGVLRLVELGAGAAVVAEQTRAHARVLQASEDEIKAAMTAVRSALASDVVAAARGAERVLREAPFHLRLDDGRLVEGTLDLAFRSAGQWTVVDWKTDLVLDQRRDAYRRQLSWYVTAVERLTGEPATGVLVVV